MDSKTLTKSMLLLETIVFTTAMVMMMMMLLIIIIDKLTDSRSFPLRSFLLGLLSNNLLPGDLGFFDIGETAKS